LITISVVPPLFVVSMVLNHQPPPEPTLTVTLGIEVQLHRSRGDQESPRLLPVLTVTNPTSDRWRNVAVCLNKQFFYYHPGELAANENFATPLEFFVTKGGNVAFQPGSESVHQVTVYAQIPSGARAVSENYFAADGQPLAPASHPPAAKPTKDP
jgi:hypothetical protein